MTWIWSPGVAMLLLSRAELPDLWLMPFAGTALRT